MLNYINQFYKEDDGGIMLSNQDTLRKTIGITGMLLPVVIWLFVYVDSGFTTVFPSISHYYYSRACGVFEIVVGLIAIFLLIYKGHDPIDFYTSTLSGIGALIMLLFPTDNLCNHYNQVYNTVAVTVLKDSDFRQHLHLACAGVFLGALAFMSFFIFTMTDSNKHKTAQKIKRNLIYRICGIVMVAAMVFILLAHIDIVNEDWFDNHCLTFWMEVVAVEAFGISWLIKGKSFFQDIEKSV